MESLWAACHPGLESVTAEELRRLGFSSAHAAPGGSGAAFSGTAADIARANLFLRSAERVLVRLAPFHASDFPELRRRAARLPWERFLAPGAPAAVRVHSVRSRLYHERGAGERIAGAIADRLGSPPALPAAGAAAQLIDVRLEKDVCAVSVDTSGEPLHRRGYRLETSKAPLRETLAAALVLASGWDPGAPLIDPFCGSGTIAIEAALLALGLAPGRGRRFSFMDWPGFDPGAWEALLARTGPAAQKTRAVILASDRDAGALAAASANAARAGVAGAIEFSCKAVSAVEPPAWPGWIVSNPPYGVRLQGSRDLRDLYAAFGNWMRTRCPGWRAALLCASVPLARATGLAFGKGVSTLNGGLPVRILLSRP